MQSTLFQMAAILEKGGYPPRRTDSRKRNPPISFAPHHVLNAARSSSENGDRPTQREKNQVGFFLPDAFSNPEHVQ